MAGEILNPGPLIALDYVGITVFAVSGAFVAAKKRQTLVTFIFFAVATGIGGGTLRDLLIGAPVFWVSHNTTLLVCLGAALAVWLFTKARAAEKAILWFDALGIAAYGVYGTEKALRYGIAPVPACFMGVMTACAGGIIRDLLAGHPSIVLRPEVYVTAAALSAGAYGGLVQFEISPLVAAAVAGFLGFGLRGAAILYGFGVMTEPPRIVLSKFDYERLEHLLDKVASRPDLDALREELDRAELVEPEAVPDNLVTMNSMVQFRGCA